MGKHACKRKSAKTSTGREQFQFHRIENDFTARNIVTPHYAALLLFTRHLDVLAVLEPNQDVRDLAQSVEPEMDIHHLRI